MNPNDRFKFESLEDAALVCGQLAKDLRSQEAMILGLQTFVCALMATHHNHNQMQLVTTSYLQHILSAMPADLLSDEQRNRTSNFVQGIQAAMKPTASQPPNTASRRPGAN